MTTLSLGICFLDEEEKVISKRVVGTDWTINTEQDLKRKPNVHMLDEISNILTDNLKLQLTTDTIKEMIEEIGA